MHPDVSIIVPTYCEALNIPALVGRVKAVLADRGLTGELLIMDDNSPDETPEVVSGLGEDWVRLIVRTENRGLSPAVLDGIKAANGDVLVVMDADLSHPPEAIPALIAGLEEADFVLGSRYVPGASSDEEWGMFRRVNSWVATLLARPLTPVRDPMSGFFAIRRETLNRARSLNPVGYKIGLELLVKCRCERVKEIPIHFSDRKLGESKLNLKEQLKYIQHLRRLFIFKFGTLSHLGQFLVVGMLGVPVNLAILTVLLRLGVMIQVAVALSIGVTIFTNFLLNRRFTFSYARRGPFWKQLAGFTGACSLGAVVNYGTTLLALRVIPTLLPQLAALVGIGVGFFFNFVFSRFAVFKRT